MRYSLEPKYRKYAQGYGFLSLINIATKAGLGDARTASKRVVQKTAEATGHLIGSKIADKITSVG